jgi:opacity protein-like surface antigen
VKDDVVNAFAQVALSPKASIQAEYRYRKYNIGDVDLLFSNEYFPDLRQEDKTTSFRLGFHYAFSPGSDLIASLIYQDKNGQSNNQFPIGIENHLVDKREQRATDGELQYLYRSTSFNAVAGGGYVAINGNETFDFSMVFPPDIPGDPPVVIADPTITQDLGTDHLNMYLYTYLNYLKNVTFTIGASYDKVQSEISDTYDKNQFNPKLGVTWNPVANTTLRAAAFRTLKRTLVTNQTLEPTQVAGFNQFYDDVNSTESWNYGVAVDQKFNVSLYGGLEYMQRNLKQPTPTGEVSTTFDRKEKMGRAYLYGTPHKWVSLTGEYSYERLETPEEQYVNTLTPKDLKTQRVPLGINVSHPSGLGAMFKATYYNQKGEFFRNLPDLTTAIVSDSDTFWLCDAAIGYRLPQRYGILSIGAKNLFNQSFLYYDTDRLNPAIQPDRVFYAKITLSI